ncbi:MAG: type II secretion system GspH family protein [Muribaculaceae bacterium]|nr:type II secretion system GspH family protein [Muribaculaceae bacterium]
MKKGFTLAEVLITLGIIGVVAAMTIPNLITNQQKKTNVTKLQRAISILNQAYKLSFDELGEPENIQSNYSYFQTYWAPYIKVATYCQDYLSCGYKSEKPFYTSNGILVNTIVVDIDSRTTFYTHDGFIYVIFPTGRYMEHYDGNPNIIVDINGATGPNIVGKDVFILTRVNDENKGGEIYPLCKDLTDEEIKKHCGNSSGSGFCCAEKIRRAGWQIDKSYPW